MAETEFIITLKVTTDANGEIGYKHPTGWDWKRILQRRVAIISDVEVLNCSPLRSDEELTDAGWSENLERQREIWEEGRG